MEIKRTKQFKNCWRYSMILLPYLMYLTFQPHLVNGQSQCYGLQGCSDYSNFGYNSTSAATLEYDNYVSAFHSTVVRDADGSLKVWGEYSKADGVNSWLVPTPINAGNYPGLTGKPLKVAIGSAGITNVQFILLTDDSKLWVWGKPGTVVHTSLASSAAFQQLSIGLPAGVTAANVKMIFATYQNLLLTTCDGSVYILTQYWANTGNGSTTGANIWNKVQKTGGGDLTGIVAARGCNSGFIALDGGGNLWTWGYRTWDGINPPLQRNAATPVALPAFANGNIKMIGMTGLAGWRRSTVYILYENGNIFSIGDNHLKQLGNWTTVDSSQTWVQPKYSAGGAVMDNIKWISPQEHDNLYSSINVLTSDKKMYNWGQEDKFFLGRGVSGCSNPTAALDPGEPIGFTAGYSNSSIIAIETGGHTSMALRECEANFGYIGHRINGSMGDNSNADECDNTFHFNTNAIQVCGASTTTASLGLSVNGPYCVGNTVTLLGSPSGGAYSIDPTSSATAVLTGNTVTFTGAGTLRVNYTVTDPGCGVITVSKVLNIDNCGGIVTIPGTIWIDEDHDAVFDGTEVGFGNGLWANIIDPDGIVIASVKVDEDGTYSFELGTGSLSQSGDYSIILTNTGMQPGDPLTTADSPTGGFEYTGINRGSTGVDIDNKTGKVNVGDLSAISGGTTIDPVNFGISDIILPVTFGSLSATIRNGVLMLNWSTIHELNNDHFEVEASTNGKDFVKIGEIESKAVNGNSDTVIEYKFDISTYGHALGVISIFSLMFLGSMYNIRRKFLCIILVGLVVAGISYGCRKKDNSGIDLENGAMYIRIAQVDKDGTKSYSKVVKVIRE